MKIELNENSIHVQDLNLEIPINLECSPEYYFHLVNNLDEFTLKDAISFEIINRLAPIYDDMVGKYDGPQRIGLFANTYFIEDACTRTKINPFNLFKYPVRFQFGDNTHTIITGGDGNYAPDLIYKSSGSSGITFTAEVKSYSGKIEDALKMYGFKDTQTGFPYNSTFLMLYNRDLNIFELVAEDKVYYNFNKSESDTLRDFQLIEVHNNDKTKLFRVQQLSDVSVNAKLSEKIHDVHSIKWNKDLIKIAKTICDEAEIEYKIRPRKNF